MARKNKRQEYRPMVLDIREPSRDWVVTLTNGSGTTTVEVTGTRKSAWLWSLTAGAEGGIKPGRWYPVDIQTASDFAHGEDFVTV